MLLTKMMNKQIKIVLLGDSITQGIGSYQLNYEKMLSAYLARIGIESQITNLALTGTTIEYGVKQISQIQKINPDYIIIMYGSVDVQMRPNIETNKWGILSLTPKRYKNIKGMLNPRPFMSSRKSRYILDCIDNLYRRIWKKVVIATQGMMQYLSEEQFEHTYMELLHELQNYNVICTSTMFIDDKIYTGKTVENYETANRFIKSFSLKNTNVIGYADLYNIQKDIVSQEGSYDKIFCKDHFHPNENGYQKIADALGAIIESDLC